MNVTIQNSPKHLLLRAYKKVNLAGSPPICEANLSCGLQYLFRTQRALNRYE